MIHLYVNIMSKISIVWNIPFYVLMEIVVDIYELKDYPCWKLDSVADMVTALKQFPYYWIWLLHAKKKV